MTLRTKGLKVTLSIMKLCHYTDCHCAKCRNLFIGMLNVIRLNVVRLNVVAPNKVKKITFLLNFELQCTDDLDLSTVAI
jgi:hypothetical protein